VGDAVRASAADTVDRADAVNTANGPCIGFVLSKPNPGQAVVQFVSTLTMAGPLVPGATYYLGLAPGTITSNVAAYVAGNVLQRVGYALDITTLVIQVDRDFQVLS
jgi:hypothetical protein